MTLVATDRGYGALSLGGSRHNLPGRQLDDELWDSGEIENSKAVVGFDISSVSKSGGSALSRDVSVVNRRPGGGSLEECDSADIESARPGLRRRGSDGDLRVWRKPCSQVSAS